MSDNLSKLMRRPRQYWYADGLPEIAIGFIFLAVGLLFSWQAAVPERSPWKALASLGLPILIVGGLWVTRWLVGAAKARLTYPRTGFVAYPRPSRRRRVVTLLIGLLLGAGVSALLVRVLTAANLDTLSFTFPLQGFFVGLLIAFIGQGLIRFYVVGGFTALLGIALAAAALPEEPGSAIFYGLLGLALVTSGGITLWRYLQQNPLPEEAKP
jgi:hypothetical protein